MKKIVVFLSALLVITGLSLAAAAATEPPVWSIRDGVLTVEGLGPEDTFFAACYDAGDRFLGARMLTARRPAADMTGAAVSVKFIWTQGESYVPQAPARESAVAFDTVTELDGQVTLTCSAASGAVTQAVTDKITGKVTSYSSKGQLTINGQHYAATALDASASPVPVSTDAFRDWYSSAPYPFDLTFDFYLDPAGDICWIEIAGEFPDQVCIVTGANWSDEDGCTVRLLYPDGGRRHLSMALLDGQPITRESVGRLNATGCSTFYLLRYDRTAEGYGLIDLSKQSGRLVKTAGDGTSSLGFTANDPVFTDPALDGMPRASRDTRFLIAAPHEPGDSPFGFLVYKGYSALPKMEVYLATALVSADAPLVDYVYLEALPCPDEPPEGCVFLPDHYWVIDYDLEDVCQVNIVDTDGVPYTMRVTWDLATRGIGADSMRLDQYRDNAYVGKFHKITSIDTLGTVSALEAVNTYDLTAVSRTSVTTKAGSWQCDSDTSFVCVDLGWTDDPDDFQNKFGVREPDRDLIRLSASGIFFPDRFFVPGEVGTGPDCVYQSVQAAVIPRTDDPGTAGYVYVLRVLW